LNQNERILNVFLSKLKTFFIEVNFLNEEKFRLEYNTGLRSESINKQINEIKSELESTQGFLNEKSSQNKKLNFDFVNLLNSLETKALGLQSIREQLNDISESNSYLFEEKTQLEEEIRFLKDKKFKNKTEVDKILLTNQKLEKKCREEEILIKNLESEKHKYLSLNEELRFANSDITHKIKRRDENINHGQKQLEESNLKIYELSHSLRELERNFERLKLEYEDQNSLNQKEFRMRSDKEIEKDEKENQIREKEREFKSALIELDSLTCEKEKLCEENTKIINEIDRLKTHIHLMTEGNKKVYFQIKF
jgi:chromosome segregation ATPase